MIASLQQRVHLYAAGSLPAALIDIAKLFAAATGQEVEVKFGRATSWLASTSRRAQVRSAGALALRPAVVSSPAASELAP